METLDLQKLTEGVATYAAAPRPVRPPPPPETRKAARAARLQKVLRQLAKRKMEGLQLYRELPRAAPFHASQVRIRLVDGPNQGGKTLATAVEVARAVTGTDPHDKYPRSDGVCLCVGYDDEPIGDPMWKKLARPGAFTSTSLRSLASLPVARTATTVLPHFTAVRAISVPRCGHATAVAC